MRPRLTSLRDTLRLAGRMALGREGRSARGLGRMAIALVALCGQLVGLAHFALARHQVCAEHGEVVDLGHGAPPDRSVHWAESAPAATDDRSPVARLDGASLAESEHEHCPFALQRRERVALAAPASVSCCIEAQRFESLPPAPPAPDSRALLLAAPKTSPPIARV